MRYSFIDRDIELGVLEKEFSSRGLRLIIIYGRRRVGKTYMLKHFCRDRPCFIFIAVETSKHVLYRELARELSKWLGKPVGVFENIDEFLSLIAAESRSRTVIVLDEFQYLAEADPEAVSRIQRFCDLNSETDLVLILCGSSVSFFEKRLLGYTSPIFGRRASSLKLRPLGFLDAWRFYPSYSARDAIYVYSVFGGTPAYLSYIDESKDVFTNISENILRKGSYLYDEAVNFLRQEVREPQTYISILTSVANGYTKPSEVANLAGVTSKSISKYIDLLEHLDIVERIRPVGRRGGETYIQIVDPYFMFWFTYVKPNISRLELGYVDGVLEEIKSSIDLYTSRVLEVVFRRDLVYKLLELLNIEVGIVGKWWHKGEEIDVVSIGRSAAAFIEIKWGSLSLREALGIAKELEAKASTTGLQKHRNMYIVVSREVQGCGGICVEEPYIVVDLLRVLEDMKKLG